MYKAFGSVLVTTIPTKTKKAGRDSRFILGADLVLKSYWIIGPQNYIDFVSYLSD